MKRLHDQNVSVERQLMELRKELQSIENEENRAFMEDMIRKAESSLRR
jgi:glucosamine 6-phosphate synthetase-like amidotransferase/phosphosugar isomerase protein